MQTFSMDEDYTEYIHDGKNMLGVLLGEGSVWQYAYGLYAAILNFVAPIAGGAVIFEILASIFPSVRLAFAQLAVWKEKYYFSELNEASLELAKSICGIKRLSLFRPVIVFTDAYVDDEEEKSAELMLEAKRIGAICVRDDLAHVRKHSRGRKKYFLIDRAKDGNLRTLTTLASGRNSKYLKKAEIYLFTEDDAYVQVESNIQKALKAKWKITDDEDARLPVFIPVRSHRNLISNMVAEVPLYEPLIGKERNSDGTKDLTVTILGTGSIGTQMFLTTYWIGQMLDCRLTINLVSQETEAGFWDRIDYINPEIKRTMDKNDPLLRINDKGDMAPVYCQVNFLQCDAMSSQFVSLLQGTSKDRFLLDTDYFLVALGGDSENISVANTLRRYIGVGSLLEQTPRRRVINYVVYDSELADTLNQTNRFCFADGVAQVYMSAVGSRRQVYSCRNVFMTDFTDLAKRTHEAYLSARNRKDRAKKHRSRMLDDYKYWSNVTRGLHVRYKQFSLGLIHASLFDVEDNRDANYRATLLHARDAYNTLRLGERVLTQEEKNDLHRIAWLEHRRWNAFTRVMGFRSTEDYPAYAVKGQYGSYKQMDLKLHPCLVECDQRGIHASMDACGRIDKSTTLQCTDKTDFDRLDKLSYDLLEKELNDYDFKLYDYPDSEPK